VPALGAPTGTHSKLSFTPGFNRVVKSDMDTINRFNGCCSSFAEKTVETVNVFFQNLATPLNRV
jgi:hypothetical protein